MKINRNNDWRGFSLGNRQLFRAEFKDYVGWITAILICYLSIGCIAVFQLAIN